MMVLGRKQFIYGVVLRVSPIFIRYSSILMNMQIISFTYLTM